MSTQKHKHARRPWRENIEAFTVAVVMAVMLKYFAIEAYKIPTGSMQPTLMGLSPHDLQPRFQGDTINDRILVDKLSFHFRDPARWEVVIFKYPLNRAQNFVKRLVGMPGEYLRIQYGDLWVRADPSQRWEILRRPRSVQDAQLKPLDLGEPEGLARWRVEGQSGGAVKIGERSAQLEGAAELRFVARGGGAIVDDYGDGYPPSVQRALNPRGAANHVGDLRWTGRIRARSGLERFEVEIAEGGRRYVFTIPGPAATDDAAPRIAVTWAANENLPAANAAGPASKLAAERWTDVLAQNIDDRLTLEIDGRAVAEVDVTPNAGPGSSVGVRTIGGGAALDALQVSRDIYYTVGTWGPEWKIEDGHYFMLGDNTQDSSDSREWAFVNVRWKGMPEGREVVRGNARRQASPQSYALDSNPIRDSGTTYLRDQWGELHVFPTRDELVLGGPAIEPWSLVPRHLIAGRALAVFWPLYSRKYGTCRLGWIR